MVIAWLKDKEETTLKRFYSEGPRIRLQPANSAFDPIFCSAEDVEIKGRVIHIRRKLI
jgi:repressor LexA